MPKIEKLYAYIAHEKKDPDDEGVTAFLMPAMGFKGEQWMPMVGADEARMKSLKQKAQEIANTTGQKIALAEFSVRTDLETIEPLQCDSLCIRFMNKDCCTEREDGICDRPDEYREIGDVADALNEAMFK